MSDPSPAVQPRLIGTLEEIAAWREATEAQSRDQLASLANEEAELRKQLDALKARLRALKARRGALDAELAALDLEEQRRSHRAVIDALSADRDLVQARSALHAAALEASAERVRAMLAEPGLAEALREYDAFAEAEAGLAALPASYREAIRAHHRAVEASLQPLFAEMRGDTLSVEAAPAAASVVASVAYDADQPEVLVLVIPVEEAFLDTWESRPQDLCASLAYRMMATAVRIAARLGAPEAPIRQKGFEGHVAIWIWLRDSAIEGDLRAITQEEIARMQPGARELALTKLSFSALWLPADLLQEPEEPTQAEPTSEHGDAASLSTDTAHTAPGEAVGDDDTEDEEVPPAVLSEDEPIPDFYVSEGE